jgi:gas vesicle protein
MSSGNFAMGLLVGAAAGAVLGILFAPARGSETRRTLARKGEEYAEDLKNQLTDKFNELVEGVTDSISSVRGEAEDMLSGKSTFDGAKNPTQGNQKLAHSNGHTTTNR